MIIIDMSVWFREMRSKKKPERMGSGVNSRHFLFYYYGEHQQTDSKEGGVKEILSKNRLDDAA